MSETHADELVTKGDLLSAYALTYKEGDQEVCCGCVFLSFLCSTFVLTVVHPEAMHDLFLLLYLRAYSYRYYCRAITSYRHYTVCDLYTD